jgi:hypothetical protein
MDKESTSFMGWSIKKNNKAIIGRPTTLIKDFVTL